MREHTDTNTLPDSTVKPPKQSLILLPLVLMTWLEDFRRVQDLRFRHSYRICELRSGCGCPFDPFLAMTSSTPINPDALNPYPQKTVNARSTRFETPKPNAL